MLSEKSTTKTSTAIQNNNICFNVCFMILLNDIFVSRSSIQTREHSAVSSRIYGMGELGWGVTIYSQAFQWLSAGNSSKLYKSFNFVRVLVCYFIHSSLPKLLMWLSFILIKCWKYSTITLMVYKIDFTFFIQF